jgi:hypothetical protein
MDGRYAPDCGRRRNTTVAPTAAIPQTTANKSARRKSGPSLRANFTSDRNCHSTRVAQLMVRWAAETRARQLLFPTRIGQLF